MTLNHPGIVQRRGIFISYRRSDDDGIVDELFKLLVSDRHLSRRFEGRLILHYDRQALSVGRPFETVLFDRIRNSRVVLAVIGPEWTNALNGRLRKGERDFVREEIALALSLSCRVALVLVAGARPPDPQELPPDLADLAHAEAFQLHKASLATDTRRIALAIEEQFADLSSPTAWWRSLDRAAEGLALALVVAGVEMIGFACAAGVTNWLPEASATPILVAGGAVLAIGLALRA